LGLTPKETLYAAGQDRPTALPLNPRKDQPAPVAKRLVFLDDSDASKQCTSLQRLRNFAFSASA